MQYRVAFDVENFEFWGGAKEVYERCVRENKVRELAELLETIYGDDVLPTDIDINDFVTFNAEDYIFRDQD